MGGKYHPGCVGEHLESNHKKIIFLKKVVIIKKFS